MDRKKALEFTRERIESIERTAYENKHHREIAEETLEYLRFIEKILEGNL